MLFTAAPIIQQQEITATCNNNCPFCYNPERITDAFDLRKSSHELNLALAKISTEKGVMAVCLTGGEPLLSEDLLELLEIYKSADCYTSINSNGRLIDAKIANKLKQSGLNSVLVSIHGINADHDALVGCSGAFNETWKGIINLKNNEITLTPNFVLTAKNLNGLLCIGEKLLSIGIQQIAVTPFLPSWGVEIHKDYVLDLHHYKEYFLSLRKLKNSGLDVDSTLPIPPCLLIKLFPSNWEDYFDVHSPRVCMAGRSFGVISPDGNFRPCIQAPYFSEYGGQVLNDYQNSWRKASKWACSTLIPKECINCNALSICGGGCRTSCLWQNSGQIKGKTMYMHEPLTKHQADKFLRRTKINMPEPIGEIYAFKKNIKARNEEWGIILFNQINQSFTVLSKNFSHHLSFNKMLKITNAKLLKVLLAMQAVDPAMNQIDTKMAAVDLDDIHVLPGNLLFPRLGIGLTNPQEVYCLRADTGERYFF